MRVLFLIPVRVSKSYEYRVLAQCDAGIIFNTCERRANVCGHRSRYHVGINFNTCERVGQMHVVVGLDIMWVLILIPVRGWDKCMWS